MSEARVHRINVSRGGVPKRAIERGRVTRDGLEGDAQAKPEIHGGPTRALSLFAKERIDALAAEGHPIAPGTIGENLTLEGLDWDHIDPGARLRIGRHVRIEITGYAAPCRTIAGSFSDGRFGRLNQLKAPGWSRLYAAVIDEGEIRAGDAVVVEARDPLASGDSAPHPNRNPDPEAPMRIGYVNLYVTDLERSLAFFRDTLGTPVHFADEKFGYASLDTGAVRMGLARIDPADEDQRALVGRQTGIGFAVADLAKAHASLAAQGVAFPMKPAKQPWGGFMAMFEDPDGNVFYLDEIAEE
jgi:MOSC domain-containing protein YiiM/predicted enzyme related to lactoylglutathione lyase